MKHYTKEELTALYESGADYPLTTELLEVLKGVNNSPMVG